MRVFLDASVFIYAIGGDHPLKDPCTAVLHAVADGELTAETSALVVQEVVHQRARRTGDRSHAAQRGAEIRTMCLVHAVTDDDLEAALTLFSHVPRLDAADAVHAAVAHRRGLVDLISSDRAFDDVEGLHWIGPAAASEALLPGGRWPGN